MPTWAIPADAPSRNKPIESWSLPKLPSTPTAVLASAPALSELNLLRDPQSVAAQTAVEHVRKLESSGAVSRSGLKPAYAENGISQVTRVGESRSTPSNVRQLSRDNVKNDWRDADYSRTLVECAAWAHPTGETKYCIGKMTSTRHPGPKRTLPLRDRDVLSQDVLPTTHDLNDIRGAGLRALKLSVTSWPPLAAQCSCSIVFVTHHIQPRAWIVVLAARTSSPE